MVSSISWIKTITKTPADLGGIKKSYGGKVLVTNNWLAKQGKTIGSFQHSLSIWILSPNHVSFPLFSFSDTPFWNKRLLRMESWIYKDITQRRIFEVLDVTIDVYVGITNKRSVGGLVNYNSYSEYVNVPNKVLYKINLTHEPYSHLILIFMLKIKISFWWGWLTITTSKNYIFLLILWLDGFLCPDIFYA